MNNKPNSLADAKKQAKALRASLSAEGRTISHSKSLELIASQYGFRDWNSLHATLGNQEACRWKVGDLVTGRYLSQPFTAEITAVKMVKEGWHRLSFQFAEAVDVVTFEGFSNFRHRTSQLIGPDGTTKEKTSDGVPHMQLDLQQHLVRARLCSRHERPAQSCGSAALSL